MYARNKWNNNKKFSLPTLAQDVLNNPQNIIKTSCCIDTTKTSCQSVKTSCCIDTTKVINGPCSNEIITSCCIDTTKE